MLVMGETEVDTIRIWEPHQDRHLKRVIANGARSSGLSWKLDFILRVVKGGMIPRQSHVF